jgi:lysophospholipase L1-like esterase
VAKKKKAPAPRAPMVTPLAPAQHATEGPELATAQVATEPGTTPSEPPLVTTSVAAPRDVTNGALLHLAQVVGVLAALMGVTYVAPPLYRFRPWVSGDPLPVAHHFQDGVDEVEDETEAPRIDETELEALAAETPVAPPPVLGPELSIAPEEYAERTESIVDPSGAMHAFYRALAETARGRGEGPDAPPPRLTRVAHFGDSTIALDGITMTVRERLQERFGDGGHGFVLAADAHLPYRHHMVRNESEGSWSVDVLTHLSLSDGRYGIGGVRSRSVTNASAWFATDDDEEARVGTAVSRFEVLYQRHPRGGQFRYRVDEGEWIDVDTRAETVEDAVLRVEVPEGPHRLSIRTAGHGESRFYGVVLEREGSGVVYDSLGIVGARAARMLGFDPAHLRTQLEQRQADLVVIGFGGNDADDERGVDDFTTTFRDVARLIRTARPSASCLLFAPLDQAERDERGRVRTLGPLTRIVTAMRSAAEAEGCAFFDTFEAMGGEGSMARWSRMHLASSDYRHATPAGYRVIGNLFYQALLEGFAAWLAEGEPGEREEAASAPPAGAPTEGGAPAEEGTPATDEPATDEPATDEPAAPSEIPPA